QVAARGDRIGTGINETHCRPFLVTEWWRVPWMELLLSRTSRTVLGVLGHRVRSMSGRHGSGPWSGYAGAGSLTPGVAWSGLSGPMPDTIAPVVAGRCRPSPDRVALGASSDRHRGGFVPGGRVVLGGQGLLPVLSAPFGGVGRVHRNDADPGLNAH